MVLGPYSGLNPAKSLNILIKDCWRKITFRICSIQTYWLSIDKNTICFAEMNAKGVILKAFEQYRLKTCIDFKPWEGEKNYISVFKGSG